MHKRIGMALVLLFLASCFCRSAMSRDTYDSIEIGMSVTDLESLAGEPRDVRSKGSEIDEYEYVERIRVQAQPDHFAVENIYYIDVLHGQVVGKRMVTHRTPAYNILYDTQPNFAAP